MTHLTESTLEETALAWLDDLGYTVIYGSEIAPKNVLANLRGEVLVKGMEERL